MGVEIVKSRESKKEKYLVLHHYLLAQHERKKEIQGAVNLMLSQIGFGDNIGSRSFKDFCLLCMLALTPKE
jgi:hypothetical protein